MNRYWLTIFLICSMILCVGCATKRYVRDQVTPIIQKVNNLDDETAKNTNEIKEVDSRAQQSIATIDTKADEAVSQANAAEQQAAKAQQSANDATRQVAELSNVIANSDNYRVVNQVAVHFAPGKDALTAEATKTLDELGAQLSNARNYIIAVEGGTDSAGDQDYNYSLSERRASVVMHYLALKYNVPAFKIHVVGLGEDKPVASNDNASGRAQNRRANVEVLSVTSGSPLPQPRQ